VVLLHGLGGHAEAGGFMVDAALPIVMGQSLGGLTALSLAAERPDFGVESWIGVAIRAPRQDSSWLGGVRHH
jgi:pimeloyl-ACP methyl ester carboxylesterase